MSEFSRKERMFLRFLSETGRVKYAWQLAGGEPGSITNLYAKRRSDKDFAKAWAESLEQAGDMLEDEAVRRAKDGYPKDVYYKGEVVGHETQYSDGLMAKLLDGAKPEKYAPKRDHAQLNVQIGLAVIPMTAPSVDEWERQAVEHQTNSQPLLIEGKATEIKPVAPVNSKKVIVV